MFEALDEEIGLTPGDGRKEGLCIWRNRLFSLFFSLFSAHGAFHNWRAETIGNMENVGEKKEALGSTLMPWSKLVFFFSCLLLLAAVDFFLFSCSDFLPSCSDFLAHLLMWR